MLEWLKRHAWKACIRQKRIPGSNPGLSAGRTGSKLFRKKIGSNLALSADIKMENILTRGYSPSSFSSLYAAQINAKRSCNGILANVRHSSVPLVLPSR